MVCKRNFKFADDPKLSHALSKNTDDISELQEDKNN